MVTGPQQVAMQDAIKGVEMFKKTSVPILGYVSNMSAFVCPCCGTKTPVNKNAVPFSEQTGVEKLGEVPFEIEVGECCDAGSPVVISRPESDPVRCFLMQRSVGVFRTNALWFLYRRKNLRK